MTPSDFSELQTGWYNAVLAGLGTDAPLQLLDPANPLIDGPLADILFWQYFNFLPPDSLNGSFVLSGGNQFLANYQAVLSALQAAPNDFESTVGTACFDAWNDALRTGRVAVGSDPGTTFRVFATSTRVCADSAAAGARAITAAYLDPIFAAQQATLPYQPSGSRGVTFVPGYSDLAARLAAAPGASFGSGPAGWDTRVAGHWSSDATPTSGLCAGESPWSPLSLKFAADGVAVDASFNHLTTVTARPGSWFRRSALAAAYASKVPPPWIAGARPSWSTTFGRQGNMQRFTTGLVVVDGMDVTIESTARFTAAEQAEIAAHAGRGLWPIYTAAGGGATTTTTTFASGGGMTIRIASRAGVPIVLAALVSPAGSYLEPDHAAAQEPPP